MTYTATPGCFEAAIPMLDAPPGHAPTLHMLCGKAGRSARHRRRRTGSLDGGPLPRGTPVNRRLRALGAAAAGRHGAARRRPAARRALRRPRLAGEHQDEPRLDAGRLRGGGGRPPAARPRRAGQGLPRPAGGQERRGHPRVPGERGRVCGTGAPLRAAGAGRGVRRRGESAAVARAMGLRLWARLRSRSFEKGDGLDRSLRRPVQGQTS